MIVLIACALATSACASEAANPTDPGRVQYQVTFLDNGQGDLGPTRAVIVLDEEFAVLDGNTGCHRILGSFTLDDTTGVAGFTVPGLSTNTCDQDDQLIEDQLLEALEAVVSFRRTDAQLEFFGQDQKLVLVLEPIS